MHVCRTLPSVVSCGSLFCMYMAQAEREALYNECEKLATRLKRVGVRSKADLRNNYSPGWRFADWELKGVPLRLELGPKVCACVFGAGRQCPLGVLSGIFRWRDLVTGRRPSRAPFC